MARAKASSTSMERWLRPVSGSVFPPGAIAEVGVGDMGDAQGFHGQSIIQATSPVWFVLCSSAP